jgi:hypothetical protein
VTQRPALGRKTSRPPSRSELPRVHTAARAPSPEARAAAKVVVLDETSAASVATIMAALPDPQSLPAGALVIVPAEIGGASGRSFARSVLAVFGRVKAVTRARRCSALVARGYVDVGAAEDETRADLAWGRANGASASEEADAPSVG